jgi:aspartate aminotransferase-like enzyme
MNTPAPNTAPPSLHQYQTIETQEDLQQDFEEEIKAVIKDELACLRQENEHLRIMQEHLARWKAMVKRSQVKQQHIEQERATQVELQRVIEDLHQQEQEPSMQEPLL